MHVTLVLLDIVILTLSVRWRQKSELIQLISEAATKRKCCYTFIHILTCSFFNIAVFSAGCFVVLQIFTNVLEERAASILWRNNPLLDNETRFRDKLKQFIARQRFGKHILEVRQSTTEPRLLRSQRFSKHVFVTKNNLHGFSWIRASLYKEQREIS
jgi:hypothetical protein